MHLGEAAGIAANLCIRYGVLPRDVPVREIQAELLKWDRPSPRQDALTGIGAPGIRGPRNLRRVNWASVATRAP